MIHTASVIALSVSPLTALIAVFLSHGELPSLTEAKVNTLMFWVQGWALLFFPVATWSGIRLKNRAMDIYDELFEKEGKDKLQPGGSEPDDCQTRLALFQ